MFNISKVFQRGVHLQEYQSKQLMAMYGVNTQKFKVASSPKSAVELAKALNVEELVVKAQIHAGGRGKGIFSNGLKSGVHILKEYFILI